MPLPERRKSRRLIWGFLAGAFVAVIAFMALVWGDLSRDEGQAALATEAATQPAASAGSQTNHDAKSPPLATEVTVEKTARSDARVASDPEPAPVPRKRVARKKRSAELGTVSLVTRGGWAEVFKNGKSLGSTPKLLNLPPGRHKLVLRPSGKGAPMRIYVDVESGRTKKVSIPLD